VDELAIRVFNIVPNILETDTNLEAKQALMDVGDGTFCIK
jgi:hypothetical protein